MAIERSNHLYVSPEYQPVFREVGLDADAIFDHPDIRAWRTLDDRENCTLDAKLADGRSIRFHVKRYAATRRPITPAERESRGFQLLEQAGIPAPQLVGWGRLVDRRSFIITADLAGYKPADQLIAAGFQFQKLRNTLADLAARLHDAGLHHRDLYLCHFFLRVNGESIEDQKLIDVARVKKLPSRLTRQRWIVKDLAQFWYSTLPLPISDAEREAWLARYMQQRNEKGLLPFRRAIERKVARIAKHDKRLRRAQPKRNISIPK